jgi:uncharacterized protein
MKTLMTIDKSVLYYSLSAPSRYKANSRARPGNLMFLNNIVISVFCLLIIPISALAGEDLSFVCSEFTLDSENTESITTENNDIPFKKGMLWKIKTPDGKTNYLFGTMHSQDYAVSKYPSQVRLALVKSKTLLMETLPNEEANQAFINHMYFKDGQRLDKLLEKPLYEELEIRIEDYGVEHEQVKYLKPWAAFSLIGRPKPVRAPTLESNLLKTAQQSMLQIKSLETMDEILSALDELAMEDQLIILKDTICNHDQIIHDTKVLVDLYVKRDLQGIVEFNNQPHYDEAVFKRFMQGILYNRNSRMLERIENEFRSGDVFVAVGASHLADKKGLLNELHKLGYDISPVY